MRESKDITREELINMIRILRGALVSKEDVLYRVNFDIEDHTPEELKERIRIFNETDFEVSLCEGDVKTASEKIAELEKKLAAANAFIEANKDVIAEKAAKVFISATKTICENVDKLGRQMVDIIKRACDDCPHRQEIPCETCKMVEEVKEPEDLERLVRRGWLGKVSKNGNG